MNDLPVNDLLLASTRRQFFSHCGMGLGSVALASLMADKAKAVVPKLVNPFAPKGGHGEAKAKRVIFLFMAGGPSQLELFDYKPKLVGLNGQPIPQSYIEGKRFAFMGSSHGVKCLGTRKHFERRGQAALGSATCCLTPAALRMTSRWSRPARRISSTTRRPSYS